MGSMRLKKERGSDMTNDDSYFKRGARIKPETRAMLTRAIKPSPSQPIRGAAYVLAMANLQKTWARRWLKSNGYFI